MSYSGGDLDSLTCNHPLGQFSFDPYAGEDSTYTLGGNTSDDDDSKMTSNGKMIDSMVTMRDSFSCCVAGSPGDGVYEQLKAYQSSPILGTWTATNKNGQVYRIKGKPVGTLAMSGKDSKIELKLAGESLQII